MNSESSHQTAEFLNSQLNNYDLSDILDEFYSSQLIAEKTKLPSYIKMFNVEKNEINNPQSHPDKLKKQAMEKVSVISSSPLSLSTPKMTEHLLQNTISDSLIQIPAAYPPFICYLHGLSKDVEIIDISMAFMSINVKFTEIKIPSTENLIGSIIFKNHSDLMKVIERQTIKINDINVILSLSMDNLNSTDNNINIIDENINKISTTLKYCTNISPNHRTTTTKSTMAPITRSSIIDERNISLIPPFLLYLYNIPYQIPKETILAWILQHCKMMNFDVKEVKSLNNSYSVEFRKRSDLIGAVKKNNFIFNGIQLIISIDKKSFHSKKQLDVTSIEAMDSEEQYFQPKNYSNDQLQKNLQHPTCNYQQFQQNNIQHTYLSDDQQLNQMMVSSFQNIERISSSSPNPYWVKLLNVPPQTTVQELGFFFKTFSITLVRVIFSNNGICFCQFSTENEMIISLKLPLTTLFIFGMPIAIASVTIDEAILLTNSNNVLPPTIFQQSNTNSDLTIINSDFMNNNNNNQSQQMKSVTGKIISLADQLAQLSGKIIDDDNIAKENPFLGLFLENNVDIAMDNRKTEISNNNRGRTKNQRQSKDKNRHHERREATVKGQRIMPWSNKLSPLFIFECCKCKLKCNLTCSSCGFFYCSIKCQQNDWSIHKHKCRFPELITSAEFHEKLKIKLNIKEALTPISPTELDKKSEFCINNLVSLSMSEINKFDEIKDPLLKQMNETPMVRGEIYLPHSNVPKPGASVLISAVLDDGILFIRSADPEDDTEYKYNLSIIAEYAKLCSKPLIENPVKGQVILAPFTDNLERALVLKQKDNLLAVAFIDFGNIEIIKFDECYDLSGNLQVLKRYVHKVKIDVGNPENRSNGKSKEVLNFFKGVKFNLSYKLPFTSSTLVDLVNPISGTSLIGLLKM